MTEISVGTILIGKVDQLDEESIQTKFFVLGVPLIPLVSYYVAGFGQRAIEIKLNPKSILVAYMRTWIPLASFMLMILGLGNYSLLILSYLGFTLMLSSWWLGRLPEKESLRRQILAEAVGTGVPPRLLPKTKVPEYMDLLETKWRDATAGTFYEDWKKSLFSSSVASKLYPLLFSLALYSGEKALADQVWEKRIEPYLNKYRKPKKVSKLFAPCLVIGFMLAVFGYYNYMKVIDSVTVPQRIELSAIEQGSPLTSNYVEIADFWQFFPMTFYNYQKPEGATSTEVEPGYVVNNAYYPIISDNHAFITRIRALVQEYGSAEAVPVDKFPTLDGFTVLVWTTTYKTIGAIPTELEKMDKVQGLISSLETSPILSQADRQLIRSSFPLLDFSKTLVLQEGRRPAQPHLMVYLMFAGASSLLFAVWLLVQWFIDRRQHSIKFHVTA